MIPKTPRFSASTIGGDWRALTVNSGNLNWEIRVTLDTTTRSDTGKMNASPSKILIRICFNCVINFTFLVTFVPPVLQLRAGTKYVLEIPTYDADGDVVKCRWASNALNECAGKFIS